jgi:hypothetical protein
LVCRLSVKLAPGNNVTASVDWGDGSTHQTYIVDQSSIFIEKQYSQVLNYVIKCTVIETNSYMTENVYIRRNYKALKFLHFDNEIKALFIHLKQINVILHRSVLKSVTKQMLLFL